MAPSRFKLFTAPTITRRIRLSLLAELFGRFTHLLPNKHALPKPSTDNESYFDILAQILEQPSDLPDSLIQALHDIEARATALLVEAQNNPGSDPVDSDSCCLRQAIQLWLSSHPESNDLPRRSQTQAGPTIQEPIPPPGSAAATPHSALF